MITTLLVDGMLGVHSVRAIFTALTAVEGILTADVGMGRVVIEHDGRATEAALRDAVAVAGYEIRQVSQQVRRLPVREQ